jgi:hypothetical protein
MLKWVRAVGLVNRGWRRLSGQARAAFSTCLSRRVSDTLARMNLYLSPHNDDVCFSIGCLASRAGGELVTLFTQSRYVAVDMDLPAGDAARAEVITQLRREEDQRFANAAGLARREFAFQEPPIAGRRPFDLADLDVEIAALSAELIPFLSARLLDQGDPGAANLYCPMGVGAHRDHLTTLLAVRRAYDLLRPRCTVFLYEDLHYASVGKAREAGLQRAGQIFAGMRLTREVLPLEPAEIERKMAWINFYASQHPRPPQAADFIPASGAAAGPHEVVWRVSA